MYGRVAERPNAPVLKTGEPVRVPGVRIPPLPYSLFFSWKSGRVADCVCLENRFTSNGDEGSNPSSSVSISSSNPASQRYNKYFVITAG